MKYVLRILELFCTDGAIHAFLTWPKFSLASFLIVTRMKRAGVNPLTVIDVGANVGQFSVAAAKLFDIENIYPIEPEPNSVEKLYKNVGVNIAKNVFTSAVGDESGKVTLHVNVDSQASSLLELGEGRQESFPEALVVNDIEVEINRLDQLFHGVELKEPVLLKIDAQGFEDKVLKGASQLLRSVSWVLVEVSFSKLYEGECDFNLLHSTLTSHGFEFIRPMDFHTSPRTGEIIEMDALFCKKNAF